MQGNNTINNVNATSNNPQNNIQNIKHSQQQQPNQGVRYHNQYYKYQKTHGTSGQLDPQQQQQQYQMHYQMQQQQNLLAMQMPSQQTLLHQQQQLQHQQMNASHAPDYQINNMFAKLSVSDIQLSQSVNMNQMTSAGGAITQNIAKPQPVNRKLFIKSANNVAIANNLNTAQINTGGGMQSQNTNFNSNDMIPSNTLGVPSSSHIQHQMSANENISIGSGAINMQNVNTTPSSQAAYQTHQDSVFTTRPFDNFDSANRMHQLENQTQKHQQHQQLMQNHIMPSQYTSMKETGSRLDNNQNMQTAASTNIEDLNHSVMSPARQQLEGANTNRPQSAVSFTQNDAYSRSGASTRRQQSIEPVQSNETSQEVIISNIDRDTVGLIIHELHSHGVQDLTYKFIEQKIFIVKFKNKESANWAIEKYDGQEINGMKLQVRQVIQEPKQFRLRRTQFLPLQGILESNENGDEDVGSDGSNNSNREGNSGGGGTLESLNLKTPQNQETPGTQLNQPTPDLSQIKANMLSQQRVTTPKVSSDQISGTAVGYGSSNKYSAQIQNNSVSPNPNFQQNQMMQQSMTARQQNYVQQQIHEQYQNQTNPAGFNLQNQQQLQFNGGGSLNLGQSSNPYEQLGNIQSMHSSFYQQNPSQLMNKQISPGQMSFQQLPQQNQMTSFSQYHQNMQNLKRSSSGGMLKIQNKLAHTMNNPIKQEQSSQNASIEFPQQIRKEAINKNLSFQQNTHKFKSEEFDDKNLDDNSDKYSAAFGYNSSGSGLLIQQQPQQNMQQSFLENQASFGKISESIDNSQNDESNMCQINYDVSNGSERESINNQTLRNGQNTFTVKNISTRSDSDHSHQITHQIMVQQYQSPESAQKLAMTQRLHNLNNSLDYMMMSNSGRNSPQRYSTPGSKLNNSFHHFGSSQNLSNYIRVNNEIPAPQQHQGAYHARNFSAEQQFYQSELMQQQLYLPQALNQSHLNHSMSMHSIQHIPTPYYNYLSTSQDLNNVSLYGQPMSLNQQITLSNSNSSIDLASARLSIQNQSKKSNKGGGGDQQKNHQQLKNAYKESSEPINEEYYNIDDNKIKTGQDMRTTVMVRNIPNKYKQKNLLDEINQNNKGKYDFVYLPIDFQNNANIGYAFVNFLNPLFILEFKEEFQNRKWRRFQSQKKCEIRYGRLQGIAQLSQHFQNSTVSNQVDVQVRPRVFEENTKKDWTKEINRICTKYSLNPQTFLNFKNSTNNQQTLSNNSVNSSQPNLMTMMMQPCLDKSRSVDNNINNNQSIYSNQYNQYGGQQQQQYQEEEKQ